jgi:hypothetical protein
MFRFWSLRIHTGFFMPRTNKVSDFSVLVSENSDWVLRANLQFLVMCDVGVIILVETWLCCKIRILVAPWTTTVLTTKL